MLSASDIWNIVESHLEASDNGMIIVDDSVQEKRYARFIELVKRQYSGNTKSVVNGIGLVNMVYSALKRQGMRAIFIRLIIGFIIQKQLIRPTIHTFPFKGRYVDGFNRP